MCEDADSLQEDDCHHQLPDSMDMGPGTSGNGAGAVTNAVGQFHHHCQSPFSRGFVPLGVLFYTFVGLFVCLVVC